MPTEQKTAAAAAVGKTTGTKDTASASTAAASKVSAKEVDEFSAHCVYVRSVYTFMMRIWRDSDSKERKVMEGIAPLFFSDMGKVLGEFLVIAACRITDPAVDSRGNQNFSVELFTNNFARDTDAFKQLDALRKRMNTLRDKVSLARRKLGAHADREVIRKGEPLPAGSWKDWDDFWSALKDFVRILKEHFIRRYQAQRTYDFIGWNIEAMDRIASETDHRLFIAREKDTREAVGFCYLTGSGDQMDLALSFYDFKENDVHKLLYRTLLKKLNADGVQHVNMGGSEEYILYSFKKTIWKNNLDIKSRQLMLNQPD